MRKGRIWLFSIVLMIIGILTLKVTANDNQDPGDLIDELQLSSSTLLDSNLFTQPDDLTSYTQPAVDMTGYEEVIKNDNLTFYVDPNTFAIRILYNGYYWSSSPVKDYEDFNQAWRRKLSSPFSYIYVNQRNNDVTRSMLDSQNDLELDMEVTGDTVHFYVDMKDTKFRVHYTITVTDYGIEFNLPHDGIEEYDVNRLLSLSFFEFFGAAKLDEIPGYNFIPSGNGSLVRYNAHPKINVAFISRFYAQDLYYQINSEHIMLNYPVFGAVHGVNQNAYFVNVTSGAEYAEYNYLPPKFRTDYHMQYLSFYVREKYQQAIEGSRSITMIEKNLKPYDISFNISFLKDDDANYVGMAKLYKEYLKTEGILENRMTNPELQLHLDVLGGDYEKGLLFKTFFKMTTVDDILTINEELTSLGVDSIYYTLRGFNKGGYTDASFKNYKFNKKLGDFDKLNGLDFDYYYNPTVMHRDKDNVPRGTLETIDNRFSYELMDNREYYRFYIDIDEIRKKMPDAKTQINKYGGIALDGLSNLLYSNENHARHEMPDIYQNLFSDPIAMYNPNEVMLKETARFLTVPFQHERLRFFTDNVPFLQIVLSGYVPYYSTYLNFSANMHMDILRTIDFGSNPAYLITYQPSHLLTKTFSREFYASYYGNLKDNIAETYRLVSDALEKCLGQEIINRQVIDVGVVVITYANNIEVVVNYNETEYNYLGTVVAAGSYLVRE